MVDYDQSSITTSHAGASPESSKAFLAVKLSNDHKRVSNISSPNFSSLLSDMVFFPNVVINMFGDDAQISFCSPRKPGILASILYILEKHQLEIVSAHISSDQYRIRSMYMIHVHVSILLRNLAF
ncbi:hypothetical protein REPUB_Repub02eG0052400 [Reevesia pubescens]